MQLQIRGWPSSSGLHRLFCVSFLLPTSSEVILVLSFDPEKVYPLSTRYINIFLRKDF